jgi:molybdenum cofactor synthesis domain-containing protein
MTRSAFVLTISDQASVGGRLDESGPVLVDRLGRAGFEVKAAVVADEPAAIAAAVRQAAAEHQLIVATGGTGLSPRDVTPQAIRPLLDYEIPGFGELMRIEGRRSTPFSTISRSLGGVLGQTLVLVVPGNPRGALESVEAVAEVLDHALELLAGGAGHHAHGSEESDEDEAPPVAEEAPEAKGV